MAILVYNGNKQQHQQLIKLCQEPLIFIGNESLDQTINELFKKESKIVGDGNLCIVFKECAMQQIESYIDSFQKVGLQSIYAVYTENNQQWTLKALLAELHEEHQWFQAKGELEQLLKYFNQKSSFSNQEKECLMKAYFVYQQAEVSIEEIQASIDALKEIVEK
ncbi:MAG: DUF3783 domain-containing protein [Erysipelotrichaceae bacterium]